MTSESLGKKWKNAAFFYLLQPLLLLLLLLLLLACFLPPYPGLEAVCNAEVPLPNPVL